MTNKFNILKWFYFIINFLNMANTMGNLNEGGEGEVSSTADIEQFLNQIAGDAGKVIER